MDVITVLMLHTVFRVILATCTPIIYVSGSVRQLCLSIMGPRVWLPVLMALSLCLIKLPVITVQLYVQLVQSQPVIVLVVWVLFSTTTTVLVNVLLASTPMLICHVQHVLRLLPSAISNL